MPKNIISLDVGATKTRIGILTEKYKIIKKQTFATPKKAEEVLNLIYQEIKNNYSSEIERIALGIAGQVDYKKGLVNFSANFPKGLKNVPLKKILEEKFKAPVSIDNDAHCFALGESWVGQGKIFDFIIGITLGTGIGGGIIINKKVLRGKNNTTGEIGHQIIEINGRKCSCGRKGCWEAYAAGSAMVKIYEEISGKKESMIDIENKFLKGDKTAKLSVQQTSHYLAVGLSNLINILNPDAIILGGGLSNFKKFIELAKKDIKKLVLIPALKNTPILISKLGDNANLTGASLLKI